MRRRSLDVGRELKVGSRRWGGGLHFLSRTVVQCPGCLSLLVVSGAERKGFGVFEHLIQDPELLEYGHDVRAKTQCRTKGLDFLGPLKDKVVDPGFFEQRSHGETTDASTADQDFDVGWVGFTAGHGGM